jgi:hypothetical protein
MKKQLLHVVQDDFLEHVESDFNERATKRIAIREGEGVTVTIKIGDGQAEITARLFDVSTLGAGLIIVDTIFSEHSAFLKLNGFINLKVQISIDKSFIQLAEIVQIKSFKEKNEMFLGLKFALEDDKVVGINELISDQLSVKIDKSMPLAGFAYKELFYKEKAIIRVESIGKTHWQLSALDSELVLFKNLPIRIFLFLPKSGNFYIDTVVSRVLSSSYDGVRFEVCVDKLSKSLSKHLVEYLTVACEVAPNKLRAIGLPAIDVSDNFKFRYAKTPAEYEQVLRLRFEAYSKVGKVKDGASYRDMASPLDKLSRILAVFHNDTLIASITLTFPNSNDLILDTEKNLKNGYPTHFPQKTKVIEIARFCVKEEYQKSHLVMRVFQHVYKIIGTSDREMIISSADPKLLPMYKRIGMIDQGLTYEHPVFKGIIHTIVSIKIADTVSCKNMGPLRWNYIYRDMTDFLESRGRIKVRGFGKFKLWLYRLIGNITAPLWKER